MKIGYACIPLGVPYSTNRRFLLKNFSEGRFLETTSFNLSDLKKILEYNIENRIYLFRISSDIIPFGSHEINNIKWDEIFRKELNSIGKFINENSLRVSMHPGQYTILNSPNEDTVKKSIKDIEYHCTFLDSLNVDYGSKIILHIGGVYNNKKDAIKRFEENYKRLSSSARKRLVIENDEKSFNISDVLNISESLGIPVIFDNLHHKLNPSLSTDLKEILTKVSRTWSSIDGPMKLHYSDMAINKKAGAHSDFVSTTNFINFYNEIIAFSTDIMLEVKDKDLSAIKCINCITPQETNIKEVWDRHSFTVLERSLEIYNKCLEALSETNLIYLYKHIDMALALPIDSSLQIMNLKDMTSNLMDSLPSKERERLITLISSNENTKAKNMLHRLATKYYIDSLLNTYYFVY